MLRLRAYILCLIPYALWNRMNIRYTSRISDTYVSYKTPN